MSKDRMPNNLYQMLVVAAAPADRICVIGLCPSKVSSVPNKQYATLLGNITL